MPITINIDSWTDLPSNQVSRIFNQIFDNVTNFISQNSDNNSSIRGETNTERNVVFNYNTRHLRTGYKKIPVKSILINQSCNICLDTLQKGEYERTLTCGHFFHKRCIDKWLKINYLCPYCRNTDI